MAGDGGSAAPAMRGPAEGAATGVAKRGEEESTESSESSKAPDTPAQMRHVADEDCPAASACAGAPEAATQASARSAAGWSAVQEGTHEAATQAEARGAAGLSAPLDGLGDGRSVGRGRGWG